MQCCSNCFGDRGLEKDIIPFHSKRSGNCFYCSATNMVLVDSTKLRNSFELLINIYTRSETGRVLVEWFKDDWNMFRSMDLANANSLLADILDDGQIVRELFVPSSPAHSNKLDIWGELRDELMYKNRFFPQTYIDKNRLEELFSHLLIKPEDIAIKWYRARIQKADEVYLISDMGAPPKHISTQGRANPAGIPYLYLASSANTAISEIRPHTGEFASVAEFSIFENLNLVDLRDPKTTISPFLLSDENEVALLRGDIEFLVHLV